MGKKVKANQIDGVDLANEQGETVLLWKVSHPLGREEHELLADRVRQEQERSGIKIILVPFSVDIEVANEAQGEETESTDQQPGGNVPPTTTSESTDKDANTDPSSTEPGNSAEVGGLVQSGDASG